MLDWMREFLVRYPELALFLVIAAGYRIGSFKNGAFSLGPVTGALFAGLFVGRFAHVPVSGMTKSFLFLLFLFGIGYSVGPQFMQSLKRDGLKPMLLAVVVGLTGLLRAVGVAKVFGLDPVAGAGLTVGSTAPGSRHGQRHGSDQRLALPEADRQRWTARVAVADAVCYLFGTGVDRVLTDSVRCGSRSTSSGRHSSWNGDPESTAAKPAWYRPVGDSRCPGHQSAGIVGRRSHRSKARHTCRDRYLFIQRLLEAKIFWRPSRASSCRRATSSRSPGRARRSWTCSARHTWRSRTGTCSTSGLDRAGSAHKHGPGRAQASRYCLFGMDPAPLLALNHARRPGHSGRAGNCPVTG